VSPTPKIVIVGAGITGLAAALRLAAAGGVDAVVCDASGRAGGVIRTERGGERGEYLIEAGPDSFLTEKPEALRLCAQLGLTEALIGIREGAHRTYVVRGGRLVQMPDGFRLIAPTRLGPWLRSPLFSWPSKARMALDWVLPPQRSTADESVASFVTRRLGREAFDYVAQPLIGTIYTADAEALSLAATMPRFADLERRYGSVIRGFLRAHAAAGRGRGPRAGSPSARGASADGGLPAARLGLFASLAAGMQTLPDAAAARLPDGWLRLRTPVAAVTRRADGSGYRVALGDGGAIEADGVIVAAGPAATARLIAPLDGALASGVGAIACASSASVTLAYDRAALRRPIGGFGFVVPRVERRPILAASFSNLKFAGRAPEDRLLVRVFLGGATDPEILGMDDEALARTVRGEMGALLGISAAPLLVRVMRHRDTMPQYAVGHLDRVADIESRAGAHPGLALAGAAYRGVGIPDCIRSGEAAAERILRTLGHSLADASTRLQTGG
jgi:protoporphyrinogen/coproporphyrinogen III oxidase